jgi:phospholipid/cholesterol/gamma-HCH transport system substrate-binding protein
MASRERFAVGLFVLIGVLLFAGGIFLIGNRRLMFSNSVELYTEFAQLSGLQRGAKVRVSGMDAGEVLEVRVPPGPASKFVIKFRVLEALHPIVRQDSIASIQTDGLLGNKFMQVDAGTEQAPPATPDSTIGSKEPFELSNLMIDVRDTVKSVNETFGAVQGEIGSAAQTVAETTKHIDQVIVNTSDDIAQITSTANSVVGGVNAIVGGIRDGRGTVGKLFTDDAIYTSLKNTATDLNETVNDLQLATADVQKMVHEVSAGKFVENAEQTLVNVRDATDRFKEALSAIQSKGPGGEGVARDLRATIGSAREAMTDLAENMEALKRSFFFRGFFKDRGFYELDSITVADYQSEKFAGKRKRTTEWFSFEQLFALKQDGSEELTEEGQKRLGVAVAKYLPIAPKGPLVVEGYCQKETEDDQFLCSRERALRVRNYIVDKFQINSEYVGIVAMGARRTGSNAGNTNGIALTFFRPES